MYQSKTQAIRVLPESDVPAAARLEIGMQVCVRNRFRGNWSGGFEVAEVLDDGYRVRRTSDGQGFPDVFPFEEVRQERRQGMRGSHLDRGY